MSKLFNEVDESGATNLHKFPELFDIKLETMQWVRGIFKDADETFQTII